ncbi:MAG: replication initiation protein [Cetobacterium sp.]|nr:replication initiation protein [Cetobacterium sp.]MCJ8341914.1 replication initiation protein [Cetobacterium sp.]
MKKLELLYKPNQLIEIMGSPVSSQGFKVYNFLLHRLQQEKTDKMIISMSEIFNSLEISDKYEDVYEYLDSLLSIKVRSLDNKGKIWGGFNLLSEFKKVENGIFIQIPNTIFKALCGDYEKEKELYYTTIKLLEQRVYKCSYTIIFYEIFKKFEKVNLPKYFLEELREITGTTEKYKEYKFFKTYVLNKALKELNQFDSQYEYSFEEKRLGRKVHEIKFIRTEKNIIDITPEPQISEKLLKAIAKARKNHFVDSSYSQKAMDKIISMYDEKDIIKALGELYKYNSEIIDFQKILISKIDDIKRSKNDFKAIETKNDTNSAMNDSSDVKIDFTKLERHLVEISKEDYETLYEKYLKDNDVPHMKSVRIGFDKMNSEKFKIVK